ncbi:MAG: hypothetical protein ABI569_08065 [Casimicrobiaceae bacterium]
MNEIAFVFALLGLATTSAPAWGAAQRTFVASYGLTTNTAFSCSLAKPCRAFNEAISVTSLGGEVVILDTAGYGPMVINQSIKIIGPSGVYGGISVLGGAGGITTGIVINAGDNDVITLRGLDISGVPTVAPFPNVGINIQNAGTVHVERTSISNFTQDTSACMNVVSPKPIKVFINDSFLRECGEGIFARGTGPDDAARISLVIDNTRIQDGLNTEVPGATAALDLGDAIVASIRNSVLSWAGGGIYASNANVNVKNRIHVINSQLSRFGAAIETAGTPGASAHVTMANSHFNNNTAAVMHGHGQAIFTSSVVANNVFSLLDCGGGAANVTSLGYGGGNGTNTITNNTDIGPFPGGCSGIIVPTQFQGK